MCALNSPAPFGTRLIFFSLPELVYKSSCVLTVHAISHYSPDVLKGNAGVALPLAFLGMHQAPGPDEEKGEGHDAALWAEVWQDNVPGEKPVLYLIDLNSRLL